MYLIHHGIKGQKWGVRNYQYADGTLTPEGKRRYGVYQEYKKKTDAVNAEFNRVVKKVGSDRIKKDWGGINQIDDIEFFDRVARKEYKIDSNISKLLKEQTQYLLQNDKAIKTGKQIADYYLKINE